MKFIRKTKTGYRFDKRIFWGAISILLIIFFYVAYLDNFNFNKRPYVVCEKEFCYNPIYAYSHGKACEINTIYDFNTKTQTEKIDCVIVPTKNIYCPYDWCELEFLSRGEYGDRMPPMFLWFPYLAIFLVLFGLILNHLIYNQGKKFNLGIDEHVEENLNHPIIKWLQKLDKGDKD